MLSSSQPTRFLLCLRALRAVMQAGRPMGGHAPVVRVLPTKYRASCHGSFSMTATQLAEVNIHATTDATSHTSGTLRLPAISTPPAEQQPQHHNRRVCCPSRQQRGAMHRASRARATARPRIMHSWLSGAVQQQRRLLSDYPCMCGSRLVFIVDRLPDSSDRRSRRRALGYTETV